jgi:hypothetical protein
MTRDSWFTKFVNSLNIPIHAFTSVRDTQLGQLMFALETVRLKRIREGEDPGPSMLEGENASNFVPLFQTAKMFQDFISKEEIGLTITEIKKSFNTSDIVKEFKKIKKEDSEWFTTLDFDRLDEFYVPSSKVLLEVLLPLIGEKLELDDNEKIIEKIKEIDENFGNSLFTICDPVIFTSIEKSTWSIDEKDDKIRIVPTKDKENPLKLNYNDYHTRTNALYSFILELIRLIESGKKYSLEFKMITHLLTLEMLIMIPQPDKSRFPVIKQHFADLLDLDTNIIPEFWELLSLSYQAFSYVLEPQQRMFQKLYKSLEKTFKQTSRVFWKKMLPSLTNENKKTREEVEVFLAVLWCHFRVVQAQTQQQTQNQEHNYSYRAILRFEHMFWQQGKEYLNTDQINSKIHFWSIYASIANKEIRSPKDSLSMYNQFDDLFKTSKVLTNKTQRKKFEITLRDHRSIVQAIMSYGLEGKDDSIYPEIEEYTKKLENILVMIEEEKEDFDDISLEEEKKAVKSIFDYLKVPLPKETQEDQTRGRPVRRLRS